MNRTSRPPGPPPAAARRPGQPQENAEQDTAGDSPLPAPALALDPWTLVRPIIAAWPWLITAGLVGAILGVTLGLRLWPVSHRATAQLVRSEAPLASDAYRPRPVSTPTLVTMVSTPEVLDRLQRRLSAEGKPRNGVVHALPERNSDLLTVSAESPRAEAAIALANTYGEEIVALTREWQRNEAREAAGYVAAEIAVTADQLRTARAALPEAPATATATPGVPATADPRAAARLTRLGTQLEDARDKLNELLLQYTDLHPRVKGQRALIAELEAQQQRALDAATPASPVATPAPATLPAGRTMSREEWELALQQVRTLDNYQSQLQARSRAIEVFLAAPPAAFRLLQTADAGTAARQSPWLKASLLGLLLGAVGIGLAASECLRRELWDPRLKSEADVTRVTGLPVLARLGDLDRMEEAEREDWAFHTWIALQGQLAASPQEGIVCGVTSSATTEGRSTWIRLLAGAARRCGFRVLTIATEPETTSTPPEAAGSPPGSGTNGSTVEAGSGGTIRTLAVQTAGRDQATFAAAALLTPTVVTERLLEPGPDPLVHIPLPGWTWNPEHRRQWRTALETWGRIEQSVILVELPPASKPESILLAAGLPNVLWLATAGRSDAGVTRRHLATLRHARVRLAGALLNRAPAEPSGGGLSRWIGLLAAAAALGPAAPDLPAQTAEAAPLTLGPGDVLNLALFDDREAAREEVVVGPDGRLSYLEAQDIPAAGLTVDGLRLRLQAELGRHRRAPQPAVLPVSYRSRHYTIFGRVARRGSFGLDRPVTVVEAVARAGGFETGPGQDGTSAELADLSRSFLARGGRRVPVDFGRLFGQGDLTQNVVLEPGDYLYFPPATAAEVFVLGAVRLPGVHTWQGTTGALGAIAARGGFSERAWPRRIVIIRGGLARPEVIPVDAAEVLSAAKPDVRLEPRDILFVAERPWVRAEELLDAAASAFVTAAVVTYTGENITRNR